MISDMLQLACDLFGLEFNTTSYDDILLITCMVFGFMAVILIIQLFRGFIR